MNKFKYGDKVHIKPLNLDGKVLGWTLKIINGVECTCKYGVETLINNVPHIAGDVDEDDLELIEYNECFCDCCDCCGREVCEDSDCDESNWDDDEDFENNKEAENLDNDNRKEEKRRKDRENRIIKAKALARKREYEARKLAAEKYDVPMDWQDTDA